MPLNPDSAIGQTAYGICINEYSQRSVKCPDCLGTGVWDITSPSKIPYSLQCPLCSGHKFIHERIAIALTPPVLTIESVREADNGEYQYVCIEQGRDVKRFFYGKNLRKTSEEALAEAQKRAKLRTEELIKAQYTELEYDRNRYLAGDFAGEEEYDD